MMENSIVSLTTLKVFGMIIFGPSLGWKTSQKWIITIAVNIFEKKNILYVTIRYNQL